MEQRKNFILLYGNIDEFLIMENATIEEVKAECNRKESYGNYDRKGVTAYPLAEPIYKLDEKGTVLIENFKNNGLSFIDVKDLKQTDRTSYLIRFSQNFTQEVATLRCDPNCNEGEAEDSFYCFFTGNSGESIELNNICCFELIEVDSKGSFKSIRKYCFEFSKEGIERVLSKLAEYRKTGNDRFRFCNFPEFSSNVNNFLNYKRTNK